MHVLTKTFIAWAHVSPFFLLPLIFNLLATSISHFLSADMKLSGCFSTKFVFFVVYLSLSFAECMNECR